MSTPRSVRRARILVVDDDPLVVGLLTDLLTADGHEVETAPDGLIALERIAERPFDLILSDLRMPRLDGIGLYRELGNRQPLLLRRVIFITGTADDPDYARFLETTSTPFLKKPFSAAEFWSLVRRMLSEE